MEFNLVNINAVDVVDAVDNVEIIRIPRQIYVRSNYFDIYTDQMFLQRLRISKPTTLLLLTELLLEQIEHAFEYAQLFRIMLAVSREFPTVNRAARYIASNTLQLQCLGCNSITEHCGL